MKTCPYCAEEIQNAAIVCKHCKRDLSTPFSSQNKESRDFSGFSGLIKASTIVAAIGVGVYLLKKILQEDKFGIYVRPREDMMRRDVPSQGGE